MKKIILSTFSLLAIGANAQLSNLGFEAWSGGNPTGFNSSNLIAAGSVSQITTGAPEGLSAVSADVTTCATCPIVSLPNPFPGLVYQRKPWEARPANLSFKWKGDVMSGDTALVGARTTLATLNLGEALFQVVGGTSQATWTTQNVTFNYYSTSTPDSMLVGVLSDQWVWTVGSGTSSLGTHIDVDDIVFSGGTVGFKTIPTNNDLILAYPNPANNIVNFNNLGTDISMIEIFDITGNLVYSDKNLLSKFTLSVDGFANGAYVAKLYNASRTYVGSARFEVVR